MKKHSKSSKQWLQEHFSDPYVQRAQKEGYRSRAAYKLLDIQKKDHLLQPGMAVVDLGAAPGSWSQVAAKIVGERGMVLASDILPMEAIPGVTFIQGDFQADPVFQAICEIVSPLGVDLVMSDIAPNITGIRSVDIPKAVYLAELVFDFAKRVLKPDGTLLIKLFHGPGFDAYVKALRLAFQSVKVRKPLASRNRSSEVYLLAKKVQL